MLRKIKFLHFSLNFYKLEEARKQFKTYVNTLATIKNENNEKYLILRKKYYDEVPEDETNMTFVSSASMMSLPSEFGDSPMRIPPPYRAPPQASPIQQQQQQPVPISMTTVGLPILEAQTKEQYRDCVNEFQHVMTNFLESNNKVDVASRKNSFEQIIEEQAPSFAPSLPPRRRHDQRSISRENSIEQQDDNKENSQIITTPDNEENKVSVSVKEAMLKFNRFASEEIAKVPSPISKLVKSKTEKVSLIDVSKSSST